jgi:hypothetical protein
MKAMYSRRRVLIAAAAGLATACAAGQGARPLDGLVALYARPGRDEWPEELRRLPADVQAMYRYAVANREVLRWMPCTCGCVNGGHASNFDCYVKEVLPDGRVRLDTMSFG